MKTKTEKNDIFKGVERTARPRSDPRSRPATGDSLKLCVSHSEPISLYLFCTLVSHYKGKPTVFYHSIPFELFGIRRSTRLPYLIMLQKLKQNTEKGIMVREPTEITVRSYLEPDDKKKEKKPYKSAR